MALYRVDHKKPPHFSALENTHLVSLGKIALAIGESNVCNMCLSCIVTDIFVVEYCHDFA